jgi:hypothetical protein
LVSGFLFKVVPRPKRPKLINPKFDEGSGTEVTEVKEVKVALKPVLSEK